MNAEVRAVERGAVYGIPCTGTPPLAVSFDDGVITLNVRGCLDLPLGLELWEAARPFLFNAHHLVINLRDLTQICASGFTWLIMVQGKTQALGMTLAYADVPDRYDSRLRLVTGST